MSILDSAGGDYRAAGIFQEILVFCQTGRTVEEVAEEFDWHEQTAREKIWELQRLGKIKEMPRKRARKKQWQTVGSLGDQGEVMVVTNEGTIPISAFLSVSAIRRPLANVMAQALSYIYQRAYYKQQDQSNVLNVAKQGSTDPLLEVRVMLEKVYLGHKLYIEALERMLVDMPELWQDGNPAILKMFGKDVSLAQVEENIKDFEEFCRGILGK